MTRRGRLNCMATVKVRQNETRRHYVVGTHQGPVRQQGCKFKKRPKRRAGHRNGQRAGCAERKHVCSSTAPSVAAPKLPGLVWQLSLEYRFPDKAAHGLSVHAPQCKTGRAGSGVVKPAVLSSSWDVLNKVLKRRSYYAKSCARNAQQLRLVFIE